MAGEPFLVASLATLRAEFNALSPGRSKASDGWIGDAAHQAETSDHNPDETGSVPIRDVDSLNEVHAIDVTASGPWPDDITMEDIIQFLLARCRSGQERRLRYVIFNRRIWSASWGWRQHAYTGASPHTAHAHFSASYDSAKEASAASWHLEDLVALTDDDKAWIGERIDAAVQKLVTPTALKGPDGQPDGTQSTPVGHHVLSQGIPDPRTGVRAPAYALLATNADEATLAASVIAGVLAGLPVDLAEKVADELAARLAS